MISDIQKHIKPGVDGSPKLKITTPGGASAEIYLHGAHLTSWIPAGGEERFFLSRASEFGANASIRGGIPVIFPQFADLGPLPKHGFVRRMDWEALSLEQNDQQTVLILQLKSSPNTVAFWPYHFICKLILTLTDLALTVTLSVQNTDERPFSFTAALHSYLKIANINQTKINGLKSIDYIDTANNRARSTQVEDAITFNAETDRIYLNAPAQLKLDDNQNQLKVEMTGFKDAVIWNPWVERGAALGDLETNGYQRFVCIEAGAIGIPILLPGGESWFGSQKFIV